MTRFIDERFVRQLLLVLLVSLTVLNCSPPTDTTSDAEDATSPADTANGLEMDTADGGETDGGDIGSSATSLVSVDAWQQVDASSDPLSAHRPSSVDCPEEAVETERLQGEQTLSISTEGCNYFAGRQTTLAGVDAGDTLQIRVWHYELTHDESANAHVALLVASEVVWEKSVPLPTDSGALLTDQWKAADDYPAGTRIDFHLHNHGANNCNFIEFSKVDQ